jgi:starch phosphorylase
MARQLAARGSESAAVAEATRLFDPSVLTIGFARRFTPYKRPGLLLTDRGRLKRLLLDEARPVQLVIAGKAHPDDVMGKEIITEWVTFAQEPDVRMRVVFLEDYDMTLAETMVRGVDVWLNMPRRPWEACGTSGMKVVSSGGLNCSELDGWWAEAFTPAVGWAIDDSNGASRDDAGHDARDAETLYRLLEEEIIPLFYTRDAADIPREWLSRVRASMAALTPRFSANRMLMQYVDELYVPAAERFRKRQERGACEARSLAEWERSLRLEWESLGVGATEITHREGAMSCVSVAVHVGSIHPESIAVELYADAVDGEAVMRVALTPAAQVPDASGVVLYRGALTTTRPSWHFTARAVPQRDGVRLPTELPLIRWGSRR